MLSVTPKYQVNPNVDDNIVKEAELITKSKILPYCLIRRNLIQFLS